MASLSARFAAFSRTTRRRAPLYSRLSDGIATSALLPELYADAPRPARVPVTLFAAVHYLLLGEPGTELARHYPNLTPPGERAGGDPVPVFLDFCARHVTRIRELVATRLPQTNEIGRSALLVAGLGQLGGGPWAQLDVGASAGLNLMLDRLAYDDGHGVLGGGELVVECSVRPDGRRLAPAVPEISSRLGLDTSPVDLADPDAARWLEACVWPDQEDRFRRLERAVALFRADPVPVRRGDAVADLAGALGDLGPGSPVVTTSWALCYLDAAAQSAWVDELDSHGEASELSWVWVESPHQVPVLPVEGDLVGSDATVLGTTTWRDGVRTDRALARCHPHGYWLSWF
ncbi:hypothetical protein PROP_01148 [Propionicimonas sp. T2.31MG-18]|uniref:DUF2332 domain-containing protein n=1 Tax=Propionicimonas sp. T2.31MG-18 TaxID=3157620 RepID=UPI0035E6D4A6